jgi:hypothetical protein
MSVAHSAVPVRLIGSREGWYAVIVVPLERRRKSQVMAEAMPAGRHIVFLFLLPMYRS